MYDGVSMLKNILSLWVMWIVAILPPLINNFFGLDVFPERVVKTYENNDMWFMIFGYLLGVIYISFSKTNEKDLNFISGIYFGWGVFCFFTVSNGMGGIFLISASILKRINAGVD